MARTFALVLVFATAIGLSGCSSPPADAPTAPKAASPDGHDHSKHAEGEPSDMDKMKAELAKLSAEDAALAEKQHMCPVSGKMLGSMGAPQKVDVNGQQVWICCDGCKGQLLDEPDKFLAKLSKE